MIKYSLFFFSFKYWRYGTKKQWLQNEDNEYEN